MGVTKYAKVFCFVHTHMLFKDFHSSLFFTDVSYDHKIFITYPFVQISQSCLCDVVQTRKIYESKAKSIHLKTGTMFPFFH